MALIIRVVPDATATPEQQQQKAHQRLIIERNRYIPKAQRTEDNKSGRKVEYLATLRADIHIDEVPDELMDSLDSNERFKLYTNLAGNVTKHIAQINDLSKAIREASISIKSAKVSDDLKLSIKNLQAAWAEFDENAKAAGAKRTKKPTKTAVDARQRSLPGA